jgi:hypothetical protein
MVGLLLAACAGGSVQVKDVWTAPGTTRISFQKVAVFMADDDQTTRRVAEDALAARLSRTTTAVPGYQISLPPGARGDQIAQALTAQGFDGAVVMRIVGSKQKTEVVPTPLADPYFGFSPYWDLAWGAPGYVETDTYTTVETNVYALTNAQQNLIWSSRSEAIDVADTKDLVDEVAAANGDKMREEGLLGKP